MSFTENDRKVRSEDGRSFPDYATALPYRAVIAAALREEFGGVRAAVKRLARVTNSNERAVRNWFEGKNGPSGESLIRLIEHSDRIYGAVLDLAHRHTPDRSNIKELRVHLAAALVAIDNLHSDQR